jgi:hypothetical protein
MMMRVALKRPKAKWKSEAEREPKVKVMSKSQ